MKKKRERSWRFCIGVWLMLLSWLRSGEAYAKVVDRAGWHTAQRLPVPENIRLLPRPARSPELNPTEHIGEELWEKNLPTKSFRSLRSLETTLCEGLTQLAADPKRVRSLTDFPYMRVTF